MLSPAASFKCIIHADSPALLKAIHLYVPQWLSVTYEKAYSFDCNIEFCWGLIHQLPLLNQGVKFHLDVPWLALNSKIICKFFVSCTKSILYIGREPSQFLKFSAFGGLVSCKPVSYKRILVSNNYLWYVKRVDVSLLQEPETIPLHQRPCVFVPFHQRFRLPFYHGVQLAGLTVLCDWRRKEEYKVNIEP